MRKPSKSCYVCGSNNWWWRPASELGGPGGWLCGRCHPNPNPNPGSNPGTEEKYGSEVLALRDRVISGNKKLNDALEQIKGMAHDSEEWSFQMELWHQANVKLDTLCDELKLRGYEDCLYLDEEGKRTRSCLSSGDTGCRVCPSRIHYWEQEFDEL